MMSVEDILGMSRAQVLVWHYVMDVHDPENYWYSISFMRKEI